MIVPQSKYGISQCYRATSETVARTFNAVAKVATAGEYVAEGAVINAKLGLLDSYVELLQKFNVDTSALTPTEIRTQAEAILNF